MTKTLVPIDPCLIRDNPFQLIGADWMLITAGTVDDFNTMTASYGAMGELWQKKVCFCFVRPTRHTYRFMEQSAWFTLSFFDEQYREMLKFCGTVSGRDVKKAAEAKLTPVAAPSGTVYFDEARLVLECKKIYYQDIDPAGFLDDRLGNEYNDDYHRMYVGEVVRCLRR